VSERKAAKGEAGDGGGCKGRRVRAILASLALLFTLPASAEPSLEITGLRRWALTQYLVDVHATGLDHTKIYTLYVVFSEDNQVWEYRRVGYVWPWRRGEQWLSLAWTVPRKGCLFWRYAIVEFGDDHLVIR
jgi:hypothetical protein